MFTQPRHKKAITIEIIVQTIKEFISPEGSKECCSKHSGRLNNNNKDKIKLE